MTKPLPCEIIAPSPSIPPRASGTGPCRGQERACSGRRSARRKCPTSWSSPSSRTEARRGGRSSRTCAYAGEVRRRWRILRPAGRRAGKPSAPTLRCCSGERPGKAGDVPRLFSRTFNASAPVGRKSAAFKSVPSLREAGAGGSNPLSPTSSFRNHCSCNLRAEHLDWCHAVLVYPLSITASAPSHDVGASSLDPGHLVPWYEVVFYSAASGSESSPVSARRATRCANQSASHAARARSGTRSEAR